jgi:hypothetical protein
VGAAFWLATVALPLLCVLLPHLRGVPTVLARLGGRCCNFLLIIISLLLLLLLLVHFIFCVLLS